MKSIPSGSVQFSAGYSPVKKGVKGKTQSVAYVDNSKEVKQSIISKHSDQSPIPPSPGGDPRAGARQGPALQKNGDPDEYVDTFGNDSPMKGIPPSKFTDSID